MLLSVAHKKKGKFWDQAKFCVDGHCRKCTRLLPSEKVGLCAHLNTKHYPRARTFILVRYLEMKFPGSTTEGYYFLFEKKSHER